jgi:hypothetical protein
MSKKMEGGDKGNSSSVENILEHLKHVASSLARLQSFQSSPLKF